MTGSLQLDVIVVPYQPIVGLIPPMGEGEATWPANGIHQWLAQTDHEKRMQWIASIEKIEALEARIVVAGHKRPDARDDDPAAILGATKTCIRDFDRSLSESRSAQELVDRTMVLHGDLGNPYTLWTAAQSVFEQGQGGSP